jgi:hypothetical protein
LVTFIVNLLDYDPCNIVDPDTLMVEQVC